MTDHGVDILIAFTVGFGMAGAIATEQYAKAAIICAVASFYCLFCGWVALTFQE